MLAVSSFLSLQIALRSCSAAVASTRARSVVAIRSAADKNSVFIIIRRLFLTLRTDRATIVPDMSIYERPATNENRAGYDVAADLLSGT
jgi:hypothetical protein